MTSVGSETAKTLLEVRDLGWVPDGEDSPLWEGVSFRIDSGDLVILQGQSGSGKSTLLRCVVYLELPSAGKVYWRGQRVEPDNIRHFRHHVHYVHQMPVPICGTIEDELAFAREMSRQLSIETERGLSEEQQREMLEHFELGKLDWSRRFDELSVGERQRVALVRSLTLQPDILLLDEPTASLDDENARRVEELVLHYLEEQKERGVVWITHSREQRQRLDGRIIDIGDFRQ